MEHVLIVYYSRKGERGLAIRGCEAAKPEEQVSAWAKEGVL